MDIDYSKYSNFQLVDVYRRIDKKNNVANYAKLVSQIRHNLNIEASRELNDPEIKKIFDQILYDEDPKNYNKYLSSPIFLRTDKFITILEILNVVMLLSCFVFKWISIELPVLLVALTGFDKLGVSFKTKVIIVKQDRIIELREPNKFFITQLIFFTYSSVALMFYVLLKMKIIDAT